MVPDSRSRRLAAQVALVAGPLLAGASVVTQPDLGGSAQQQLATIATSPLAPFSAAVFAISQLAFLLAAAAIGRMVSDGAPRLSAWGTALAVLGAFGHSVYGGVMLMFVTMGREPAHRATYAALLDRVQSSPLMMFSVVGLVGTVVGLVLLGAGLVRSHTGPRWAGPALWAFVVVEFAGGAISSSASYVSTALLLVAFLPLVRVLAPRGSAGSVAAPPVVLGA